MKIKTKTVLKKISFLTAQPQKQKVRMSSPSSNNNNNKNNNNSDDNKEIIPPNNSTPKRVAKTARINQGFKKPLPKPFKTALELYREEHPHLKRKNAFKLEEPNKQQKIEEGHEIFTDISKAVMQTQIDNLIKRNGQLEHANKELEENNAHLLRNLEETKAALTQSNEAIGYLDIYYDMLQESGAKKVKELQKWIKAEKTLKANQMEINRVLEQENKRLQDKYEPTLTVLYDIDGETTREVPRMNTNTALPHHNDIRKYFFCDEAKVKSQIDPESSEEEEEEEADEQSSQEY